MEEDDSEEEIEDEVEEVIEIEDEVEEEIEIEDEVEEESDDKVVDLSGALEEKKSLLAKVESKTSYDYDLMLDPSVMSAIQESLATTPHEGFKPVVSVSPNGNLKIDFVPL